MLEPSWRQHILRAGLMGPANFAKLASLEPAEPAVFCEASQLEEGL